jgi:hypothetical protein
LCYLQTIGQLMLYRQECRLCKKGTD